MIKYTSRKIEITFWAKRTDKDINEKTLIELSGRLAISAKEKDYLDSKGQKAPYIKATVWSSEDIFSKVDEVTKNLGDGQRITVKGRFGNVESWVKDGQAYTSTVVDFLTDIELYQWEEDSTKEERIAQEAAQAIDDIPF